MQMLKQTLLLLLLLVVLALATSTTATAADLPDHFTGAGLGFQNSALLKASGWLTTCVQTITRVYGCLSTDYSGGTTSTRAEAHPLIYQYRACGIFGTGGAGAATSATGGVGGSFDAGGILGCQLPVKLMRAPGIYAVFSGSWQKRNVVEAPDIGTALKAFGNQTIWRFGVGKAW